MILAGRFDEFVSSFDRAIYEEKEDEMQWQYFLHKVFEGSFEEFKNGLKVRSENQNMSTRTFETTIKQSMKILQKLSPEKGGEA